MTNRVLSTETLSQIKQSLHPKGGLVYFKLSKNSSLKDCDVFDHRAIILSNENLGIEVSPCTKVTLIQIFTFFNLGFVTKNKTFSKIG